MPYTETVTVYKPSQTISTDLSVAPGAVVLVGTIKGNLHRGTEHSRATINNLGIFNVTTGYFFTAASNFPLLGDRYILQVTLTDENGVAIGSQLWVVHGVPAVRTRFAVTSHLRAAITLLLVKPVGIP